MSVNRDEPARLIFERSHPGHCRQCLSGAVAGVRPLADLFGPGQLRASPPELPEVAETDVVRHYTNLSLKNYGVDNGPYPLGSCTMKYNPKVNEDMAALPGFAGVHPLQDPDTAQGCLCLMHELENMLSAICGTARFTLQPAAGAHGELTGLLMIRAYHQSRGDTARKVMIIPDSAHGTNPASAMMVGYTVREIHANASGTVDIEALKSGAGPGYGGLHADQSEYARPIRHRHRGNRPARARGRRPALLRRRQRQRHPHAVAPRRHGLRRGPPQPAQDLQHAAWRRAAPVPARSASASGWRRSCPARRSRSKRCLDGSDHYVLQPGGPLSIGRVRAFYGNFGMLVRAYAYILATGAEGLRQVSEAAVTHANYLLHRVRPYFDVPSDQPVLHEFVLSGSRQKALGCSTLDIAKRIIDYGFYPPTIYFPLTVKEAMMFEPTETESRESLDALADAMIAIAHEAETTPELLHDAPHGAPISRPDELRAARSPILHG